MLSQKRKSGQGLVCWRLFTGHPFSSDSPGGSVRLQGGPGPGGGRGSLSECQLWDHPLHAVSRPLLLSGL